jgi:hypothetical protein
MKNLFTNSINKIKSKFKNKKNMKNKKVKLVKAPCGKQSSSNQNCGSFEIFTVQDRYTNDCSWYLINSCGETKGWAYEWEMVSASVTKEELESKIAESQREIDDMKSKIHWMLETGATEFDEHEHKIWKALTALENSELSKLEKVKIISSLVS